MPNRIVREGILSSERVNALSPQAELFYRRLLSIVDDYGRCEAHPKVLLAKCYPLQLDKISHADVSKWLAECAQVVSTLPAACQQALVLLYEIEGKKYLQINNFGQRTRTASKCPSPCAQDASEMSANCPRVAGSRASNTSPTTPTTPTTAEEFREQEPLEWFRVGFIGEWMADTWKVFPKFVNTPELLEKLRVNLLAWMRTKKYQNGYGKDSITFLRSGVWHNPPSLELLDESIRATDKKLDSNLFTEAGHPRRLL